MAYNIDELLKLPIKERRKISEKIICSFPENKSSNSLTEEEKQMLDERWENIKSGKAKLYTSEQMWARVFKVRNKK